MRAEAQEEDAASSLLLKDIQKLLRSAFRSPFSPQDFPSLPRAPGKQQQHPLQSWEGSARRPTAVQEELPGAHMDGAIAWLRAELLEMRFQNWQLARTLVNLNLEMQRLKIENELSTASECSTLGKIL
ncbi:alanine and arginine-rich domain-containing protein [Vombatus ursinus]|uniref:alanine and arginine-rich domain-containing protein n=1 Tax=Vombatus ursinus TaxID=29139 RepID=UPI000FFD0F68|nr:alanine and arginine-rich domain-containing protein [Vombatus ursinus]